MNNATFRDFEAQKKVWESLGEQDPLWAVLSAKGKESGRWDLGEFLSTGEADVARYHELLQKYADAPKQLGHMLDFGCGVGRLSLAWSRRCDKVTGVDISGQMVARANEILKETGNAQAIVNEAADLKRFDNESFHCVTSHICLQHIPPSVVTTYIREFGRICCAGGSVAFQLPSKQCQPMHMKNLRRWIVEHLPFGMGRIYRRLKSGSADRFRVYTATVEDVVAAAKSAGLRLLHKEPDNSAGDGYQSYIYVFGKPQ